MSTFLRVSALFASVITIALWFFGGFNVGRTRAVVPVVHPGDNGGVRIVHESRFLPGLDFLACGFLVSAALFGGSFFTRRPAPAPAIRS